MGGGQVSCVGVVAGIPAQPGVPSQASADAGSPAWTSGQESCTDTEVWMAPLDFNSVISTDPLPQSVFWNWTSKSPSAWEPP